MIHTIGQRLHDGIRYVVMHPQFLTTLILIVIIPVAFIINGQQFLDASKNNQERLEQERVGIMHDVFSSLVNISSQNVTFIQNEITKISSLNNDIVEFVVAKKEGTDIRVIASLNTELIDSLIVTNKDHYETSITQSSLLRMIPESGIRYWHAYRLVETDTNGFYYIFTKTSLRSTDALFAERIIHAYYWLLAILLVILFLLYRHMKLIDYSYLYRETKHANEMKDMFTNMIAHELRAPLTAMKGYASMVRERQDIPDDVRGYGQKIEDSAGRLVLIINDLLDVARIHSGKLSVKPVETNLQDIITSVLEIMQKSASEKDIVLSQEVIIPDLRIHADPMRLHQALTNLVSNSIKYTKSGSITLAIEDRDDRIEIRVKDTGSGISAENQQSLFKPFFRVNNADVDNTVGTGLGMWITKQLIELMKGSIAVESIRGVGTHVVVTLPKT